MAEIIDVVMRLTDNVTDGLRRIRDEMEQTSRANQSMGRNLNSIGKGVGNLASSMMPLAAGIAGAGAIGVKTFMDFDSVITGAGVKAGATAEEMQKMKDAAAQMGAKFPTTAREVAEGMDRLAAGGFDAEQTIGAMPGIIEAAIASGEDMATTSDVVTSALSTWNMMNGDIGASTQKVADIIQTANNKSKLGMQDFGLALQYAGGTAASMGVSIEDLSAAMAILSNKGLEASTIGTSLRSTMLNLVNPPKEAADALTQLGLSAADFSDSNGSFIGIQKSVEKLNNAMKDLTPTQKSVYAQMIAGKEASTGLVDLINTDASAYKDMVDSISNSNGSSEEAYLKMQNTLKGSVDALMSSIEALGISFGSAMAPSIRSAAAALKTVADVFTNMSPAMKSIIIGIGEAIVGFTGLAFATSKVLTISGTIVKTYGDIGAVLHGNTIRNKALQAAVTGTLKAFRLLRVAGVALMGPLGLVVLAIAGAAYLIYRNWNKIGPFFAKIWETIKGAFAGVVNAIMPTIQRLQEAWNTMTAAFNRGGGTLFGVLNALSNLIVGVLGGVAYAAIVALATVLTGALTTALEIVGAAVNTAIGVFTGLIEFITGVFTGDWSLAWQGIVDIFGSIFGGLKGIVMAVFDGIRAEFNSIIDGINSINIDVPDWVPVVGGKHIGGFNIPHLYTGDTNWTGGPAVINDRYGGEIVDLPSGTRVIPHDQSINQAYNMGRAGSGTGGAKITINIGTANMGSNQDIRQQARMLAEQILFELETRAINQNVGAI